MSLIFYARDTRVTLPRSLRSLIVGNTYKSNDANKVSGVYKLTVKQAVDSASSSVNRRLGRVIDSSSSYVRGEEMLKDWRPRSDSLIFEHQWELEKLTRLQQVEKTKNFLLLKNTMETVLNDPSENKIVNNKIESLDCKKNGTEIDCAREAIQKQTSEDDDTHSSSSTSTSTSNSSSSYTENQKQLLLNCIKLINMGRYVPSSEKVSPSMSINRSIYDFTNLKTAAAAANSVNINSQRSIIPNINVSYDF